MKLDTIKKSSRIALGKCFVVVCCLAVGCGQPPAEQAAVRPSPVKMQPVPDYLSPEQSMQTMHLPPGYHLQLVASEPMVQEPVAITWDGNGRMYVAEMRSYMQDIEGTGERLPISRISRLEDTDGDGVMDKHTVFIDSLVLPRMLLALDDRLVVNETYTYNLHSYRDTNGDGVADEKKLVYRNDAPDERNLEHQKSGLVWNLDNNIYVTSPVRYRYRNNMLVPDSLGNAPAGQWGIANDNYGRLFFSFAGGEVPALGFQQNPAYGPMEADDQLEPGFEQVWPVIGTPDVEGGLQRLREDSSLNHFSASCGQTIFRGNKLPATMQGDLLICEPAGRLIRRAKVINNNGRVLLRNAYDKAEFLASTDMNFRPVNTATGPDGCLYVVDMYHGIIQESQWTGPDTHIRKQILRKGLDKNHGRGRIYRVVYDGMKPAPQQKLLDMSNTRLVGLLQHPNGWCRDNAQKLLVVRNATGIAGLLEAMATGRRSFWQALQFWKSKPSALARIHALWTLDGLGLTKKETVKDALRDEDSQVRKAAICIAEVFLKQQDKEMLHLLELLKDDSSMDVQVQLILSLRDYRGNNAAATIKYIAAKHQQNALLQKMAAQSLVSDNYLAELRDIIKGRNEFHQTLILDGAGHFTQLCANCHGADGKGLPSAVAPPLAGSARVKGDAETLIKILLHGLQGPVDGKDYPAIMPGMGDNSNEYIASVLSYIRTAMGNNSTVIEPSEVRVLRPKLQGRKTNWTLEELLKDKK
ncbi:DUF7133 domain-containing protein [Foetidibacter luteolus]|uniref:DUF7133 domain-containing protein n=1 Tax=Foetidibacter luteolus TaxID=2608880 RepID=UPI00129B5628|nr:c-type cytochrome [Foetidibacter luteolus]